MREHREPETPGAQPPPPREIRIASASYPEGLGDLADPPETVFVRGELPPRSRAVALVGSRAASAYGLATARALSADLARLGLAVVSGLARGIDAAAHQGALDAGGVTVAVLPGGLDDITPRHHVELAARIVRRGALLTERPPGSAIRRASFVERNRLIAALASAVVVVEAARSSGALSTAAAARRLGRPLLAVPGDVDRPTSRGCHLLIRQGAALCEGAADVLRFLRPGGAPEGPEARLLGALDRVPRGLDTLARLSGLGVDEALPALLQLEWAGIAEARDGQRWVRGAGGGA